jgi:hypothetical protein
MEVLKRSQTHYIDANVFGYKSFNYSLLIYFGSFSWFCVLLTFDIYDIVATDWVRKSELHLINLLLNSTMFILQTINIWWLTFRLWPLTALYYMCLYGAIGVTSALLANSITESSDVMYWAVAQLLAQCLFISSESSVTLEYFYRRSFGKKIQPSQGGGSITPRIASRASLTTQNRK